MSDLKKVSIIIPCFNQSEYLDEAIKSVLASTYKNIEIVVVNDGSTDLSFQEYAEVISRYNNVKLINQVHEGVCSARNNGIKSCLGDYILPLDADDKIGKAYIEKAVRVLNNEPLVDIVYCQAEFFGEKRNAKWNLKEATLQNMLVQNRIFSAALFRKSKFVQIGGYKEEMEVGCEDWDLWLSFLETGTVAYQIPEILFYYRKNLNTRSRNAVIPQNYIEIRTKIINNHKSLYKKFGVKYNILICFMILKNILSYILRPFRGILK